MAHILKLNEVELQSFSYDLRHVLQDPQDEEFLRALRYRVNSYCLVCRLLPEMLAEIFAYVAESESSNGRERAIVTITHVCRRWREVALAFPNLWASVSYDEEHPNMEQFWLMYERAKEAKLDVSIKLGSDSDLADEKLEIMQHFLGQLYRIRELSLSLPLWKLLLNGRLPIVVDPLVSGSSSLKHLKLTSYYDALNPTPIQLPELFMNHAPELYSLSLYGCIIRWDSPIFRGLTHLYLSGMPNFSPTADELWNILRGSPALEHLDLSEVLASMEDVEPPPSWNLEAEAIIHLPRIRHMGVSNPSFAAYAQFFSHISIPEDASIFVFARVSDRGLQQLATLPLLSPAFFSYRHAPAGGELKNIKTSVELSLNNSPHIYVDEVYVPIEDGSEMYLPATCGTGKRLFAFFRIADRSASVNPYSSFRTGTPFTNVEELVITQDKAFLHTAPWHDIFTALPQLRAINVRVEEEHFSGLIEALVPTEERGAPVPLLKLLGLWSRSEISQPHHHAERLAEVLEQRAQAGARLDSLKGSWYVVSDSALTKLDQVVGFVERSD
ncbi:hypothetical protein CONPUDRAFT_162049 [Coniophora puteana RWD-64-598 SS2]|uniref:Uncharacterized protein n=1 Tax=Coniophora puteana (strain RWD-64-598) TaxID=741705 RepID=A0A5M3N1B0_CONPW|nr:uncharacterized protein CONPUDRAFT_162049 [Coniophora puteana RWD-64-598 SS2]EIW84685.1 hypothetical protein CONPUDRAFT_162049 [Coniophora puteana RWD-64-598 SS2]